MRKKFMYALVEFKGKQYKAEKGALLKVDKIDAEPGSTLDIDQVLLVSGDSVTVGAPYVAGAKVTATVQAAGKDEEGKDISYGKDKKVVVFKYMPKKDYRRKQGHRQRYSMIKIDDIVTA
jgi:large subunit ribosomal protein L21